MFFVRCSLPWVVNYSVFGVRCLLHAVCSCLLVCLLKKAGCCSLFVVCRVMLCVGCLLVAARCSLFVVRGALYVARCL